MPIWVVVVVAQVVADQMLQTREQIVEVVGMVVIITVAQVRPVIF
jgi:hypothetical protein